jgi:ATP-binding cassette subfamily B protein
MSRPSSLIAALPALTRFVRAFAPVVRAQWRLIAGAFAALLAGTLLRVLEPWPLKFVIDPVTGYATGDGRLSLPAIETLDIETLITLAAVALVLITALRAGAGYLTTVGFALAGNRALTSIRARLFRHLQTLSLGFHQRARGGDLVVRTISDIGLMQEVVVTALLPLLGNLLIVIGMLSAMLWLDAGLALIALLPLPLLWLLTWRRGQRIRQVARRARQREGALASTAAESMTAIKTIQSLALGGRFADDFAEHNSASLKEGVRAKRLTAGLERGVDVLLALATALVLWFGAHRVLDGHLSPGELLVFLAYLGTVFRPVRDLAKYTARLAKASAAADRVLEILEQEPEVRDRPGAVMAPPLRGEIRFEQVSFGYAPGAPLFASLDLSITAGTRVAIVGPSGGGKSTLTHLILRLYDPTAGRLRIDGHDLRDLQLDSLRAQIGVVLQDSLLFATSVRENIALGAEGLSAAEADAEIEAAARLANAHDFIQALPQGYDTPVGERGATLSNGQRQRLAIARAAVRPRPILILDEPTTGLDRENERLVLEALERLSAGRTTLHITHRLDAARQADRILFVADGRILEDGTHAALLARGGHYARLWQGLGKPAADTPGVRV